jgi:Tfp pilus assembly protein PilO
MRQLSEKQIMLIIAGAGLLLAGGAFGGVYWAKTCIEEEKARIVDLDGKIAEAEKKKERIVRDEEEVIILRENVAEYVKILPESAELTDYQRTIQSFATNSGVVLSSVTPGTTSGGKTSAFIQIQYNLAFRATLWQFMKFLNMFESYRRFVKVTSFRLEAGKAAKGNAADDVVHQFSLSVVTYTYNQQAGEKKPVKIANYNAKRDRLREDIYRERQNIKIDRYTFKGPRSRRDVFVDPRRRLRPAAQQRHARGPAQDHRDPGPAAQRHPAALRAGAEDRGHHPALRDDP